MPWKSPILKRAVYGVKSMFYKAKTLLFGKVWFLALNFIGKV